MKKLMILGGSRYAVPVIETAHNLGLYVITCDYLPDNIAHKFSDEYCNVSIIDKEATYEAAKRLKIDGIVSFACDPGVATAAYIAEKMGLPFQCSYRATEILQDKGLFRQFLTENGFNCPHAKRYEDKKSPFNDIDYFNWPVIVKPTDSAGSKGVTRVDRVEDLADAINVALGGAHNGAFIIEDFLTFEGYHSSTDPFTVDGQLKFATYSDQLFDPEADNPYTPAYIIWQGAGWASIMYTAALSNASKELEEAARMDGANIFQQMWYVELPAIKNIIVIQFILQAGNIMSIGFEKAYALQTDMNLPASEILSTYVYRIGLLNGDYGYSTAVGLFNSVINVILLIIVNAVVKKLNDGEGI